MGANVKMTKLSVVLIIVISTLLGYVFGVLPLWREWQGLEGRMERLHMEYQRDSRTVAHLGDSLQQYREHEGVTKQTRTNEEEVAFFLKEIE